MKEIYIVTGGGSGIGLEVAKQFINRSVILADISEDNLKQAQAELTELNIDVDTHAVDLGNAESIKELFKYASSKGNIKAVVNSAGVSGTLGNAKLIFDINLLGSKVLLDEAIKVMDKGSSIVLISSMVGHTVFNNEENYELLTYPETEGAMQKLADMIDNSSDQAYNYSKLGVLNLLKRYADEAGAKGIRVNSVSPGIIMTPMSIKAQEEHPEVMNNLKAMTPLNRMGYPKDISNAVDFLLSENASFITGTDILVDGGLSIKMNEMNKK